jgi:alpha-glucosidase
VKDPSLPDLATTAGISPFSDLDGLHDIYRTWRKIADSYPGDRILVAEMWLEDMSRAARYLRKDELNSAFNFDYLVCPWDAAKFRTVIESTLDAHISVGAPAAWVLSNHDVTRPVTRYGREGDTGFAFDSRLHLHGTPVNRDLGTRRARAAALLTMSLPGGLYVYQGEELGLWEIEDIPDALRQDPVFARSKGADVGRDGCRVPIPWAGATPPFGFSPDDATTEPWLPQPASWADYTSETESDDPTSMLHLYRAGLALRHSEPALGDGNLTWNVHQADVLSFTRDPGFTCVVNFSAEPVPLPTHDEVLLASNDLADGLLPPDTTVWLRTP